MSVTPEQFKEMAERTEKARQKRPPTDCCVCGKPITDGVRYVSPDLSRARHPWCQYRAAKKKSSAHLKNCELGDNWKDCPGCLPPQPAVTPVEKDILAKLNEQKETGSVRIVLDFWASEGVPRPLVEHRFCERKFKMDFAWPVMAPVNGGVYLECNGGLWVGGRHVRPAALLKEYEKIGEATILDWKPLFCQPSDLLTVALAKTIKRALKI